MPKFKNPVFSDLYQTDCFVEPEVLDEIIALGQSAVPDIEAMLDDTLNRYEEYSDSLEWYQTFFATHAIFLLYELDAQASLDKMLEVTIQDAEFHEFWYGDSVYEDLPQVLIKLGRNQINKLIEFIEDVETPLYNRDFANVSLSQIALQYPENRQKVIDFYQAHLQHFIDNAEQLHELYPFDEEAEEEGDIPYEEYLGLLILSLQKMGAHELTETIQECYRLELIDVETGGVEDDLDFTESTLYMPENIFEKYQDYQNGEYGESSPYNPLNQEANRIKVEAKALETFKSVAENEEDENWVKEQQKMKLIVKKKRSDNF